jgi:hypothetical protein
MAPVVPADHARNAPVAREGLYDLPATPAAVMDYAIFGGVLRSALEFPSLRAQAVTSPTWTLDIDSPAAVPADAEALGVDQVDATVTVRLHRSGDAWHLIYDDTGRFDIDRSGSAILWRAPDGASKDAARLDIMGRVLATAMHAAGDACFHASAVAMGGEAIAFLGAKGFGKSTLAWAMVRAGARLITDDTLRLQLEEGPLAHPGVHELRLRPDAATRLPPDPREARPVGDRLVIDALELDRLQSETVPVGALYLLSPVNDLPGSAAARVSALPAVPSALSLVRHAKIAPLLTGREAVALLDRVVALARRTPVRLLEVSRNFERLDEVVAAVMAWHIDGVGASAP